MFKHLKKRFSTIFTSIALVMTASLAAPIAQAQKDPIYTGTFSNTAVQGYDVVAYFTENAPVKGSADFSTNYMGAKFQFKTAENLATFEEDPEKYAPQYGGYCAWAVSQGYTAKGNAKNWRIVGDKLYLNYNNSIQKKWEADIPGFIQSGDANWPKVLQ